MQSQKYFSRNNSNPEINDFISIMEELNEVNKSADLSFYTSPQCVPATKNPQEETEEQMNENQKKFLALPELVQDKFVSHETSQKIQNIGKSYNLELLQMADISRAIRSYYFGELTLEDMPFYLAKEIPIDLSKAKEISQIIIQKIINDNSQEKAYESQLEKLPIDVAIKRYPEVGEQLITSDYIKLKSFFEPVRPSIKNWLSDYTFNIGISNHDPIIRGNYLFKNENAKKLSVQDRDKLSQILKSFEEKTPLAVNTNTRQVVFSAMASQERPATITKPSFTQSARDERQNFPPPQPTRKTEIYPEPEKQRIIQPAAQPTENKNTVLKKPQTFQTDEERLSAWRRNLLTEPASSAGRKISENRDASINQSGANSVRFSSPQTFPAEKPQIISPKYSPSRPMPKNVVDLREE